MSSGPAILYCPGKVQCLISCVLQLVRGTASSAVLGPQYGCRQHPRSGTPTWHLVVTRGKNIDTDLYCCNAMDRGMVLGNSLGQHLTMVLDAITYCSHQAFLYHPQVSSSTSLYCTYTILILSLSSLYYLVAHRSISWTSWCVVVGWCHLSISPESFFI